MKEKVSPFVWLLVAVPIVIHFYALGEFSLNYPFEDDHRVYLDFCYNYINSSTFADKISLLFTPDNESRPLLIRLSALWELELFNKINFKHILFVVNGYTAILLLVFLKKYKGQVWLQITSVFLLLSFSNWEMYFRNDVASYQLATVALSILAFYLLTSKTKLSSVSYCLFCLCFFILPFGSGVGFIAALLIVIYSLIKKDKRQWFVLGFILLFQVFLYKYYASEGGAEVGFFDNLFKYKLEIFGAYFVALGGLFQLISSTSGYIISGILGFFALAACIYYLLKNWNSKDYDFEKLLFVFVAGSLAVIVMKRYNYWIVGIESVLAPRYKLYGAIVVLLALSFLYRELKDKLPKFFLSSAIIILYALWILKSWYQLTLKNETQMMDAINRESGVNKPERTAFVATKKYLFLTRNGYFDQNDLLDHVNTKLELGRVVYPKTTSIEQVDFDPGYESDWGGKKTILTKVQLTGEFPASNSFFIELTDKNGKKLMLNGFRKPLSAARRLLSPPTKLDYLSKEVELGYYDTQGPFTCRVICIN